VIDTKTNSVEHPELVAQRLERFAKIVGKEAGDCRHRLRLRDLRLLVRAIPTSPG
jgi:methionine synthase II (cobalamin-independent)